MGSRTRRQHGACMISSLASHPLIDTSSIRSTNHPTCSTRTSLTPAIGAASGIQHADDPGGADRQLCSSASLRSSIRAARAEAGALALALAAFRLTRSLARSLSAQHRWSSATQDRRQSLPVAGCGERRRVGLSWSDGARLDKPFKG